MTRTGFAIARQLSGRATGPSALAGSDGDPLGDEVLVVHPAVQAYRSGDRRREREAADLVSLRARPRAGHGQQRDPAGPGRRQLAHDAVLVDLYFHSELLAVEGQRA